MNEQTNIENLNISFDSFGINDKILKGILSLGFKIPSPIQEKAIPIVLEGHDLIAQAQTGTGKTAAFSIPILNMLSNSSQIEALIITPTRELAMQISDEVFKLGKFLRTKTICIYGGQSSKRQIELLEKKPKVMVATPGRLLDHLRNNRIKNFNPKIIVLDESDEMLDMGFLDSIEEIFKYLPQYRQTLLFSATMPTQIKNLANKILNNPKSIKITSINVTNVDIEQKYYIINDNERDNAIVRLLDAISPKKSIIFTRMKREADVLSNFLKSKGYKSVSLHGDMDQRERQISIKAFKEDKVNILVATDVASRGLDISDVSHVFNYHMPLNPEIYVHRIGRTGRAGKKGVAITLVTPLEFRDLRRIKNQVKTTLELFEIPDEQNNTGLIANILDYEISTIALDLYTQLSSKLDSTQLACKLLSYLVDVVNSGTISSDEIKKFQESLENNDISKSNETSIRRYNKSSANTRGTRSKSQYSNNRGRGPNSNFKRNKHN